MKLELSPGRDRNLNLVADTIFNTFIADANHKQAEVIVMGGDQVLGAQAAAYGNLVWTERNDRETGRERSHVFSDPILRASMLIMFLLYSGLMASESAGRAGKPDLVSPAKRTRHPGTVFAGKIIGRSLITLVQAAIVLGSMWLYGVKWGPTPYRGLRINHIIVHDHCHVHHPGLLNGGRSQGTDAGDHYRHDICERGFMPLPVEFSKRLLPSPSIIGPCRACRG